MEDGDVIKILLNGIPLSTFIAFYISGLLGSILSYSISVRVAIRTDSKTSNTFKWKEFKLKIWRVITGVIALAAVIVIGGLYVARRRAHS